MAAVYVDPHEPTKQLTVRRSVGAFTWKNSQG